MTAPTLTFAILSGGAASRLGGRDKGLEILAGRPLIEWVVRAIGEMDAATDCAGRCAHDQDEGERLADVPTVKTQDPPGPMQPLVVANRRLDDYSRYGRTITDAVAGCPGPLAGVAAALANCATAWLLTLPVDCPQPPRDLARRFMQAANRRCADSWVAHDGERRQPLFALYRREYAQSAAAAVRSGAGVWRWQASIGSNELDFSDTRHQFRNLNTPADFAAYAAECRPAS